MELNIEKVSMLYGKKTALDNVSATLTAGGLIGLVGPNGAGKSTLIRLLATLQQPSSGDILLNGESIIKKPALMRQSLGYLPQNDALYQNLSAYEYLGFVAAAKGIGAKQASPQIEMLLNRVNLSDTGKKPLKDFSGGMRRRVGLAAALLGSPRVIIADEPGSGLDPEERASQRELLSELAATSIVLLSTHIVSDIEAAASKILLIKDGRLLFDGSPKLLIENESKDETLTLENACLAALAKGEEQ